MKKIIIFSLLYWIITTNVYCQVIINIDPVNNDTLRGIQPKKRNKTYDTIINYRVLLFDELQNQNPNVNKIAILQSKLNSISDSNVSDVLLSEEENLILFIYQQKWDSVLSIISCMHYPYKVDMLSIDGEYVYVSKYNDNFFDPLNKSLFVNNKIFTSITNSSLIEEQKYFLTLFIHSYFGYKNIQGNIKVKSAFRKFKKEYSNSRYLKYIIIDNNIYKHKNWSIDKRKFF